MKNLLKEIIPMPASLLLVCFLCYGFIKLIESLPRADSAESILAGLLMICFIALPAFFMTIAAIVGLCAWSATTDKSP